MDTDAYRMYLNYDNDTSVYVVPVLPEELQVTYKGQATSAMIDMFGEVLHKGKREAAVFKFSSFFPAEYTEHLCACRESEFRRPQEWHQWMQKLQEADKPCHFVVTGTPFAVNLYADVTSYTASETGGDPGTIRYTVELKEHREPVIREFRLSDAGNSSSNTGKRVDNREITGQKRVTASALYLRTGPNQAILDLMPRGAMVDTDGSMQGNWFHVCYNGTWGWAYGDYLADA